MRTIQMTFDEDLLKQVDKIIQELKTTRSAFIRESVQHYLEKLRIKKMEKKHREGYLEHPVKPAEFEVWEDEQEWS